MMIYVDADACPVKDEILRVADRHGVAVTLVANFGLRPSRNPVVTHVMVPEGPDVADDWIAERAGPDDIVITADIPLASRALKAGALAMGPTGRVFTVANIGSALATRALNQHLRETGESRGYNAEFGPKDRSRFLQALDEAVSRLAR
jgi:uncharacterized protein YaiI (UPF0178 family)